MILSESTQTQETILVKNFKNKLKNMRLHLTELLNKKIRLEFEIKNLQKSIKNKVKEYDRTLTLKLEIGKDEKSLNESVSFLMEKDPYLWYQIQELVEEVTLLENVLGEKITEE